MHTLKAAYKTLLVMLLVHFFIMLALMYSMVASFDEVFMNLNQVYMAAMMVAPMTFTMLLLMPLMYPDKKMNSIFYAGSAFVLVLFFIFMRTQAYVGDRQFLRSMIPHHSGAILMCEKATISDPEIVRLCGQVIESQKMEILEMKKILERL